MTERTCATCRFVVRPGATSPSGQTYSVEVCYHPKVKNQHGGYATSLARRPDDKCRPVGRGWKPITAADKHWSDR